MDKVMYTKEHYDRLYLRYVGLSQLLEELFAVFGVNPSTEEIMQVPARDIARIRKQIRRILDGYTIEPSMEKH